MVRTRLFDIEYCGCACHPHASSLHVPTSRPLSSCCSFERSVYIYHSIASKISCSHTLVAPNSSMATALPSNVHVSKHPCVLAKLSQLRSRSTNSKETKTLIHEIATIVGCEALAHGLQSVQTGKVSLSTATARRRLTSISRVVADVHRLCICRTSRPLTTSIKQRTYRRRISLSCPS
jgi:hypothetical protein